MSGYSPPKVVGDSDIHPNEKAPLLEAEDHDQFAYDSEPRVVAGPTGPPQRSLPVLNPSQGQQQPHWGTPQGTLSTPNLGQYTTMPPGYGNTPTPIWQPPTMGVAPIPAIDVPDANTYWELPSNQRLLILFLSLSVWSFAMTFGVAALILTQLAGILGACAASIYLFKQCGDSMDLPTRARYMTALGLATLLLDIFSIIQLIWIVFLEGFMCEVDPEDASEEECDVAYVYLSIIMLILMLHTWMSILVLKRAKTVQMLLNPMSSGMVV